MLKRANDIAQRLSCYMCVSRRRTQPGMPEQDLNDTHIPYDFPEDASQSCGAACATSRFFLMPAIRLAEINARFN